MRHTIKHTLTAILAMTLNCSNPPINGLEQSIKGATPEVTPVPEVLGKVVTASVKQSEFRSKWTFDRREGNRMIRSYFEGPALKCMTGHEYIGHYHDGQGDETPIWSEPIIYMCDVNEDGNFTPDEIYLDPKKDGWNGNEERGDHFDERRTRKNYI